MKLHYLTAENKQQLGKYFEPGENCLTDDELKKRKKQYCIKMLFYKKLCNLVEKINKLQKHHDMTAEKARQERIRKAEQKAKEEAIKKRKDKLAKEQAKVQLQNRILQRKNSKIFGNKMSCINLIEKNRNSGYLDDNMSMRSGVTRNSRGGMNSIKRKSTQTFGFQSLKLIGKKRSLGRQSTANIDLKSGLLLKLSGNHSVTRGQSSMGLNFKGLIPNREQSESTLSKRGDNTGKMSVQSHLSVGSYSKAYGNKYIQNFMRARTQSNNQQRKQSQNSNKKSESDSDVQGKHSQVTPVAEKYMNNQYQQRVSTFMKLQKKDNIEEIKEEKSSKFEDSSFSSKSLSSSVSLDSDEKLEMVVHKEKSMKEKEALYKKAKPVSTIINLNKNLVKETSYMVNKLKQERGTTTKGSQSNLEKFKEKMNLSVQILGYQRQLSQQSRSPTKISPNRSPLRRTLLHNKSGDSIGLSLSLSPTKLYNRGDGGLTHRQFTITLTKSKADSCPSVSDDSSMDNIDMKQLRKISGIEPQSAEVLTLKKCQNKEIQSRSISSVVEENSQHQSESSDFSGKSPKKLFQDQAKKMSQIDELNLENAGKKLPYALKTQNSQQSEESQTVSSKDRNNGLLQASRKTIHEVEDESQPTSSKGYEPQVKQNTKTAQNKLSIRRTGTNFIRTSSQRSQSSYSSKSQSSSRLSLNSNDSSLPSKSIATSSGNTYNTPLIIEGFKGKKRPMSPMLESRKTGYKGKRSKNSDKFLRPANLKILQRRVTKSECQVSIDSTESKSQDQNNDNKDLEDIDILLENQSCEASLTKSEQRMQDLLHRFENVLGINRDLKENILRQYNFTDAEIQLQKQLEERLKELNQKYDEDNNQQTKTTKKMTFSKFMKKRQAQLRKDQTDDIRCKFKFQLSQQNLDQLRILKQQKKLLKQTRKQQISPNQKKKRSMIGNAMRREWVGSPVFSQNIMGSQIPVWTPMPIDGTASKLTKRGSILLTDRARIIHPIPIAHKHRTQKTTMTLSDNATPKVEIKKFRIKIKKKKQFRNSPQTLPPTENRRKESSKMISAKEKAVILPAPINLCSASQSEVVPGSINYVTKPVSLLSNPINTIFVEDQGKISNQLVSESEQKDYLLTEVEKDNWKVNATTIISNEAGNQSRQLVQNTLDQNVKTECQRKRFNDPHPLTYRPQIGKMNSLLNSNSQIEDSEVADKEMNLDLNKTVKKRDSNVKINFGPMSAGGKMETEGKLDPDALSKADKILGPGAKSRLWSSKKEKLERNLKVKQLLSLDQRHRSRITSLNNIFFNSSEKFCPPKAVKQSCASKQFKQKAAHLNISNNISKQSLYTDNITNKTSRQSQVPRGAMSLKKVPEIGIHPFQSSLHQQQFDFTDDHSSKNSVVKNIFHTGRKMRPFSSRIQGTIRIFSDRSHANNNGAKNQTQKSIFSPSFRDPNSKISRSGLQLKEISRQQTVKCASQRSSVRKLPTYRNMPPNFMLNSPSSPANEMHSNEQTSGGGGNFNQQNESLNFCNHPTTNLQFYNNQSDANISQTEIVISEGTTNYMSASYLPDQTQILPNQRVAKKDSTRVLSNKYIRS